MDNATDTAFISGKMGICGSAPWKDGERNGYGAYFDITAHTIQSGKWIGNELIAGTFISVKKSGTGSSSQNQNRFKTIFL